ncbi:GCS-domain-containing protein [Trichodelitschia bisporula]|uniref:Glutamate--cysteine ligase n=1 Tax=Trichodelitschia bisporula TaxID=703511 RepID=A0A6G1I572_9PEZI|nr:GCS-domain-containing protein [Trichodelitschia bisporula]
MSDTQQRAVENPQQPTVANTQEDVPFVPFTALEPHLQRLHDVSIEYILSIYPKISTRQASNKTWGDELESQIVTFNPTTKTALPTPIQTHLLQTLPSSSADPSVAEPVYHPEFAKYMIESTPPTPYTILPASLLSVEECLHSRRATIQYKLQTNEQVLNLSLHPRIGADLLAAQLSPPGSPASSSSTSTSQAQSALDTLISPAPYTVAHASITARHHHTPSISITPFTDTHTSLPPTLTLPHILPGPGACGLQATFQCASLGQARALHDSLTIVAPVLLALSAATPIYAGVLVDTDARFARTGMAVDDRAPGEGVAARWGVPGMYLADAPMEDETRYLDPGHRLGETYVGRLEEAGMDGVMARYFAAMHGRDPLYVRGEEAEGLSGEAVFRSLCGSDWSAVRMKIPEPQGAGGWRVEVRVMEVQMRDWENAGLLVFVALLTRVLMKQGLDLAIPLPQVRENMRRAQRRDAVRSERFWWSGGRDGVRELGIREIVLGGEGWVGLLPLVRGYLDEERVEGEERAHLERYLDFIGRRASGDEKTAARWIRNFVQAHPGYKGDSLVSDEVCFDLLRAMAEAEKAG